VPPIRIATRASALALWQANHVADLLRRSAPGRPVELVEVSTSGDQDVLQPLSQMGGVGVFTREVQRAVLDGRADLAVHSLKDLPTEPVAGLTLAGVPARGPRFDVLVLPQGTTCEGLDELPDGARIGTGSLRRRAQLLHRRPDLVMAEVRGNVETRLRKLDDGQYDALVLAEAGLRRLGLAERISLVLGPPLMLPAAGQAAIGIECRADDMEMRAVLAAISGVRTFAEVTAERACLAELRAGCHAPVGVVSQVEQGRLALEAIVLSADGRERIAADGAGDPDAPADVGRDVARELVRQGAGRLIEGA
jgi:hydroxymethylbilane synthase